MKGFRLAKANNKYMKGFDPTNLSKYIWCLDINNLNVWAMSGYLLYGGSK